MSVTLGEYARRMFPGRSTDLWRGWNPPLQDHTVVVHVQMSRPDGDADSVIDLPDRRVAASAGLGAAAGVMLSAFLGATLGWGAGLADVHIVSSDGAWHTAS